MPVGSMAQARADELRAWSAMAAGSALPLRSFPAIVTSSTEVAEHALRQGFPYSSLRPCRQQPFYATSRFVRLRAFGLHVAASRGYRTWTPEPPEQVFGMVMHLGEGSATRLRLGQTERGSMQGARRCSGRRRWQPIMPMTSLASSCASLARCSAAAWASSLAGAMCR